MTVPDRRVRVVEPMEAEGLMLQVEADDVETEWNNLVSASPAATFCNRFEWKRILERSYGKPCYFLTARDGQRLVGVLPLVHMKGILADDRLVSLPYLDQGGIISENEEQAGILFRFAQSVVERTRARGIDLRGGRLIGTSLAAQTKRFTFALDLNNSEELWKTIGPKVRNQIRKSQKRGLLTSPADPDRLPGFFSVFSENMHRLGSPTHSLGFFQSIFSEFGEYASLYVTEDESGSVVAAGVAISCGGTVSVPWASSRFEARSSCPNHSLYWRILEDSMERGAQRFDFGRSSEGSGTYHFKKQWNGHASPLGWRSFDKSGTAVESELLTAQSSPRLIWLWRRLPRSVANQIGPVIRRRLSN